VTVIDWLTVGLLLLPAVDWLAVWALHRFVGWYPRLRTARERRRVAVAVAALTSVFAGLGLARLGHLDLNDTLAALVIVASVASLSIVNAMFLWQYRHALFGPRPTQPPEEED